MTRNVYVLNNYTQKEKYFGTTEKPVIERVKEHEKGDTESIKHWKWGIDEIEYGVLAENLPDQEAIDMAHAKEKETPETGWSHIQTGGQ